MATGMCRLWPGGRETTLEFGFHFVGHDLRTLQGDYGETDADTGGVQHSVHRILQGIGSVFGHGAPLVCGSFRHRVAINGVPYTLPGGQYRCKLPESGDL